MTMYGDGQDHLAGTGANTSPGAGYFRDRLDRRAAAGEATWVDVLMPEVTDAIEATDAAVLRAALDRVSTVVHVWIQAIDRRRALGAITQVDWAANTDPS